MEQFINFKNDFIKIFINKRTKQTITCSIADNIRFSDLKIKPEKRYKLIRKIYRNSELLIKKYKIEKIEQIPIKKLLKPANFCKYFNIIDYNLIKNLTVDKLIKDNDFSKILLNKNNQFLLLIKQLPKKLLLKYCKRFLKSRNYNSLFIIYNELDLERRNKLKIKCDFNKKRFFIPEFNMINNIIMKNESEISGYKFCEGVKIFNKCKLNKDFDYNKKIYFYYIQLLLNAKKKRRRRKNYTFLLN